MKIDIQRGLEDYEGKVLVENEKVVTLGTILLTVLNHASADDTAEQKVMRYRVCHKIVKAEKGVANVLELTVEEAADIKKMVGKFCTPLVVGQVFTILDAA